MASSSGYDKKRTSNKVSPREAAQGVDLLKHIGLVRASDIAFPSGNNVYDHSPSAPFVLNQRELNSPKPPDAAYEISGDVDPARLQMQTSLQRGEHEYGINSCIMGFGSPDSTWSLVCCDPATRVFLRAHPLFTSPLHVEPRSDQIPVYVADTPGGYGKGLYAARAIPRNAVVFREPPLLMMQAKMYPAFIEALDATLEKAMHPRARQAYDALYDCWPANNVSRRLGIARTNQVGVDLPCTSEAFGATFELLSRVNHSCHPNSSFEWDYKTFQCSLVSTEDIPAGDEITFSYADFSASKEVRREELQRKFRFKCCCSRCGSE